MDGRTRPTYNAGEFFTLRKLPCAPFFLAFWSVLSKNGIAVGMANVPATFPVMHVNGYMISGMLTRGPSSAGPPSAVFSASRSFQRWMPETQFILSRPPQMESPPADICRNCSGNQVAGTASATIPWCGCHAGRTLKNRVKKDLFVGIQCIPAVVARNFHGTRFKRRDLVQGTSAKSSEGIPLPWSFTVQAPPLRSDTNYVDIDPEAMCATRAYF
jgi:hypothetical protein